MKKLSPTTIRALCILRDMGPLTPKRFARLMWPDSPFWKKPTRQGRGVHHGASMYTTAGGYLGRLRGMGLAEIALVMHSRGRTACHIIAEKGRRALERAGL